MVCIDVAKCDIMVTPSKTSWYIIYTFPNLEKKIFNELSRRKIQAYLPLQKVIRQWSDRRKEFEVPMFPNYVFINSTETARFEVLPIAGILRFVSFEGKAAVMSDEEMINIMKFEKVAFEVEPHLIQGDDVMIVAGPFTGMQGKLFSKRGKERVGVRLTSINQSLSIEVCTSTLRRICPENSYN